jgi:outer membrane protein assembly factor BamB
VTRRGREACWPLALLAAAPLLAAAARAEDWPRFRGPQGAGISESTGLPAEFGPKQNLLWRVAVPMGRSSPIVVKDRLYLTALEGEALVTLALDARTGASVWRREIPRARSSKIFVGNSTATPTLASDGANLYAFFPDFGLVSFDAAGSERWRLPLGPFESFYGIASSPVVYQGTLALVCDQPAGAFVLAVDKDSGRVRWRSERQHVTSEGFSTPTFYAPEGARPQLITTGAYRVDAYDLETGENLWWIGKQGVYPIGSPVLFGDMVIAVSEGSDTPEYPPFDAMLKQLDSDKDGRISLEEWSHDAGFKDHFGWVDMDKDGFATRAEWDAKVQESVTEHGVTGSRIGGGGDRTSSNLVWRYKKSYSGLVTPLVYRDVLYLLKDGGIVTTLDPQTGNVLKTGRTKDAIDEYFASPVAADGKVFLLSHSGKLTVLKAGAEWEVLSVNDLEEPAQATPAIADGRIYVRTHKALYAFGAPR